jgi:hypothetical protein
MDASELKADGRFLRADQCGDGIHFTIEYGLKKDVASPGEPPRMKGVLYSSNGYPPFVLNETNRLKLVELLGPDVDKWTGRTIILYKATGIPFKGQFTTGIRIRGVVPVQTGNDEKPAPVRPHPPVPLSQARHDTPPSTEQSVDEANAELAAASEEEIPF